MPYRRIKRLPSSNDPRYHSLVTFHLLDPKLKRYVHKEHPTIEFEPGKKRTKRSIQSKLKKARKEGRVISPLSHEQYIKSTTALIGRPFSAAEHELVSKILTEEIKRAISSKSDANQAIRMVPDIMEKIKSAGHVNPKVLSIIFGKRASIGIYVPSLSPEKRAVLERMFFFALGRVALNQYFEGIGIKATNEEMRNAFYKIAGQELDLDKTANRFNEAKKQILILHRAQRLQRGEKIKEGRAVIRKAHHVISRIPLSRSERKAFIRQIKESVQKNDIPGKPLSEIITKDIFAKGRMNLYRILEKLGFNPDATLHKLGIDLSPRGRKRLKVVAFALRKAKESEKAKEMVLRLTHYYNELQPSRKRSTISSVPPKRERIESVPKEEKPMEVPSEKKSEKPISPIPAKPALPTHVNELISLYETRKGITTEMFNALGHVLREESRKDPKRNMNPLFDQALRQIILTEICTHRRKQRFTETKLRQRTVPRGLEENFIRVLRGLKVEGILIEERGEALRLSDAAFSQLIGKYDARRHP